MSSWLFALAGALAGAAQASLLARHATRGPHPLSFVGRLALVALVLVTAARAGDLLVAALGWGTGFAVAAAWAYRRLR